MWRGYCTIAFVLGSLLPLTGQVNTDCVTAQVICSDGPVDFNPNGIGIDDFANPNNSFGCFVLALPIDSTAENYSAWYYFEFRTDMPPNSVIEFTISPFGGFGEDYDFLIFGPGLSCDSLGAPVRCSFAAFICSYCPETGLGRGATDTSEGANGDGFVAPMVVQPGEGYYLMLDNFAGTSNGFQLTWGGSAAPYLNCLANPNCKNIKALAGPDMQVCAGSAPIQLHANAVGISDSARIAWQGTPEVLAMLDTVNILRPTLTVPANFTGDIELTLRIEDKNCSATDALTIQVLGNAAVSISTSDTTICDGQTLTLQATASGQTGFLWSNGSTASAITVNTGGSYSVTAIHAAGCNSADTVTIIRYDNPQPQLQPQAPFCEGSSVELDAGVFARYQWNTGSTNQTIITNVSGNYSVTVTDTNGCVGVAAINLNALPSANPVIIGQEIFCSGQSQELRLQEMYASYNWSTGTNTPTLLINAPGRYEVTVTDNNGCTGQTSFTSDLFPNTDIRIDGERAFCENGRTTLSATPGLTQYTWSNGATTASVEVETPGWYRLTGLDENGCTVADSAWVEVYENPRPILTGATGICDNGSANINLVGSFSIINWSNGASSNSIEVRTPGNYSVTVTNEQGCTGTSSINLQVLPPLNISVIGDPNFCPDAGTELAVNVLATTYRWSNGATTPTIQVFESGSYSVTITDANGCTGQNALTVLAFQSPQIPDYQPIKICSGQDTLIRLPDMFIHYTWSDGATGATRSVSQGGMYEVTITDSNGCQASRAIEVIENSLPNPQIEGNTTPCTGNATPLRTTETFSAYRWNTGANTQHIIAIEAGVYEVEVTDSNGCSNTSSVTIAYRQLPTVVVNGLDRICPRTTATLNAVGQFSSILWSNGATTNEINIQTGGRYIALVTDEHGCQNSDTINVIQFPENQVFITGDTVFCEGLMVELSASAGFLRYSWTDGSSRQSLKTGEPGVYSVTAVDENGCRSSASIQIEEIAIPISDGGPDQDIDCRNAAVRLGGSGSDNGANIRYLWEGPGITAANANQRFPEIREPGLYTLIVEDIRYGCRSNTDMVRVFNRVYEPVVNLSVPGDLDCLIPSRMISTAGSTISNNTIYQWYDSNRRPINGATGLQYNATMPGLYYFEITDTMYGCVGIGNIEIKGNYNLPTADAGPNQRLTCTVQQVRLNGSSTTPNQSLQYTWTTSSGSILRGASTLTPDVDQPGIYYLQIYNTSNGCSNTDSVLVILDNQAPTANAGNDRALDCINQSVTLNGSSSSQGAVFRYQWRNTSTGVVLSDASNPSITVGQAGTYVLQVLNTDNGCSAYDTVLVNNGANRPTNIDVQTADPSCFGYLDGQIRINNVIGGTAPYFFSLNGSTLSQTPRFDGLKAGPYRLIVEDIEGCTYETLLSLKDGVKLTVELGEDKYIKLGESVLLEPKSNAPRQDIINIEWKSDLDTTICANCWNPWVSPLRTSSYTIAIQNNLGCTATDQVRIFVDFRGGVFIPNVFSPNNDGFNDTFVIFGGPAVRRVVSAEIFDRWGNRVFHNSDFPPNDPLYGWNGDLIGVAKNSAVFVYHIEIEYINGERRFFKGDVTLMK